MKEKAIKSSKQLQQANSYVEILTSYATSIMSMAYFGAAVEDANDLPL